MSDQSSTISSDTSTSNNDEHQILRDGRGDREGRHQAAVLAPMKKTGTRNPQEVQHQHERNTMLDEEATAATSSRMRTAPRPAGGPAPSSYQVLSSSVARGGTPPSTMGHNNHSISPSQLIDQYARMPHLLQHIDRSNQELSTWAYHHLPPAAAALVAGLSTAAAPQHTARNTTTHHQQQHQLGLAATTTPTNGGFLGRPGGGGAIPGGYNPAAAIDPAAVTSSHSTSNRIGHHATEIAILNLLRYQSSIPVLNLAGGEGGGSTGPSLASSASASSSAPASALLLLQEHFQRGGDPGLLPARQFLHQQTVTAPPTNPHSTMYSMSRTTSQHHPQQVQNQYPTHHPTAAASAAGASSSSALLSSSVVQQHQQQGMVPPAAALRTLVVPLLHQQHQTYPKPPPSSSAAAGGGTATTITRSACSTSTVDSTPRLLHIPSDDDSLSPYQCLVRKQIEMFEATEADIHTTAQGRNRPITIGQVGIRCVHCGHLPNERRARGAVYFPSTLLSTYQTAQNMANSHLIKHCLEIPNDIREELLRIRPRENSESQNTRKSAFGGGRGYWASGLRAHGVIETEDRRLRFGTDDEIEEALNMSKAPSSTRQKRKRDDGEADMMMIREL